MFSRDALLRFPDVKDDIPSTTEPHHDAGLEDAPPPVVRLRLWLETRDGMFFGTGRGMLLEAVDRYGSLKKAAEHLGMSYRAAWGKIKKTEKVLGVLLIEQAGSRKGGHRLTPGGRLLMEKFRIWFDAVEASAVEKARELFPWPCLSFSESRKQGRKRPDPSATDDANES
jgi:molybdate transport system regulatory protein